MLLTLGSYRPGILLQFDQKNRGRQQRLIADRYAAVSGVHTSCTCANCH
jgi:hypothetical protein